MRIFAFIPARYGSSRFPGKPLQPIAGKPMIQHIYERVQRVSGLEGLYIATDDERIKRVAKSFCPNILLTDSAALSGSDRIALACQTLDLKDDDLIINIQGDQPLIHPESIQALIDVFRSEQTAPFDIATLAYEITDPKEITNPKDCKVVFSDDFFALYFSRAAIPFSRDDSAYKSYKHLGVYVYTKKVVDAFVQLPEGTLEQAEKLEQLRALENGMSIKIVLTPWDSLEVDEPEDIQKIEQILRQTN